MQSAYLALILHAHLPFVRHPDQEDFLEEDWLYEAISETYLPMLAMFRQMAADQVPFRLTMTFSPTLCAMLRDPLLQARAERYLARGVEMARYEVEHTKDNEAVHSLAKFYLDHFERMHSLYVTELNHDIVGAYAQLQEDGYLEIITCAATHGFLPLMASLPEAMRAQIQIGKHYHRECFGRDPVGIWLPECAYAAGIEGLLQEANLRWFVIDAHGVMLGQPRPRFAIFTPYYTPKGPACVARDRESSRQVWSAQDGYPGDPAYRDFYRDVGQDWPDDVRGRFFKNPEFKRYTGIKYHRISQRGADKDLYRRDWAMGAADSHAEDFLHSRVRQFEELRQMLPLDPLLVSPFDAELFGHWWFEGPEFLNLFLRKAVYDQKVFQLATPSDYLAAHSTQQILAPSPSSWGHKGYWEVWLDPANAWIYPHLHGMARRMTEQARRFKARGRASQVNERLLRQMARELLLAQSSDWAFLMKTGTAREYATERTKDHIVRFNHLYDDLVSGKPDKAYLADCEHRHNLFENLNWRYFA